MADNLLRPGIRAECVISLDEQRNKVDVRNVMVYDSSAEELVISQTSPRLLPSIVGKRIAVTYVDHNVNVRYGVTGKVEKIIKNYRLSSSQTVAAVILTELSLLKEYNIRMSYRVRSSEDSPVILTTNYDEQLEIIDISASGVKFAHKKIREFKKDQVITLLLRLQIKTHEVKARVVRKEQGKGIRDIEFVAVQFLNISKKLEDQLARKVREIERQNRYKQMFI